MTATAPSVAPPNTSETPAGADQSLADMAQRLEAALRKPAGEARPASGQARAAPSTDQNKTAIYDTLEQEMANLLGRPSKS